MKEETVRVNFRFPKSLVIKLKKQAAEEYRTLTALVISRIIGKKNGKSV